MNDTPTQQQNPSFRAAASCDYFSAWDAHFKGRLSPEREHEARQHLPTCAACQRYYERQLLFARLNPNRLPVEERLGRGLGIRPRSSLFGDLRWPALGALAAVAAAVTVFVAVPDELKSTGRTHDGFQARGAPTARDISVYRVVPDGELEPVSRTIRSSDELAFGYRGAAEGQHLLVFGVDASGEVRWYHPAWTDPSTNPSALAVQPAPIERLLPDAIAHSLPPGRLMLYGVLSGRAWTVQDVERELAKGPVSKLFDAGELVLQREVEVK